ncbi:hypothetical protein [Actinokineospora globicatena]|uniref:hypothetical protein n=1 Tax=Actinokineospora globicatena TaxID=103729 RepID=UPI0020A34CA2|nr:hypothetical protein [Actinokineospora globicatena]MCP2300994.1 hypothetical protein [Actinokineospora globicatena]GLW77375.1 hypothetical protein Aglo01_18570 [Actinokineospora globicatena]GLW84209.1 hypothetical protein Aglo02_18490 [Actinokineospora globicatena]
MESWRIIATALLGGGGVVLVLLTMAKVRDRSGRSSTVAISGAIAFTALLVLCVVTITVLPAGIAWVAVVVVGVVASVLLLVG